MKIIVLTGGTSSERNVALASGRGMTKALREGGHIVKVIDPIYGASQPSEDDINNVALRIGKEFPTARELRNYSNKKVIECINSNLFDKVDVVVLGLHGKFGEDGKIQSLLEMRGVKYTGSGVTSSAMAMDKDISKIIFNHFKIPTPKWFMIEKNSYSIEDLNRKIKELLYYPVVIKPNDEGSTVGLSIVQSSQDFAHSEIDELKLKNAVDLAFNYTDRVMVEEYIDGRELTVVILGEETLPVIEIKPKDGFYDYEHKYTSGKTEYICPADLPDELTRQLRLKSLTAHKSLGCKAYSRVDFRLNPHGEFFCLEVNTLPGMTELSLVPKAGSAAGLSFPLLLDRIIELSLK